ncbi:MAG: nicotinate phosphoribosyltransferase [Megasphaera sp.]|nr:nicotinate phosphoribosyltransferase [Megasphaera sp.]MCH4188018.1 nicotinate phosphoribosyltransferase [Megasphaera sp.]MCH4217110.1 nicotinate phosphoribosyltransferase [Megasphaera sp.]
MYTSALLTDLYQLTMMQGLFFEGKHEQPCVFDRYYRDNPFKGGYSVVAGLEHLIDYVHHIHFNDEDLAYLKSTGIFQDSFLDYLKGVRFTGDIYAMPEGTVAFPQEVLLRVETKKDESLLLETCMSMIMNHESLIATKARRVRTVSGKDALMEFGLRRAQGESAGVYGARSAMIGGFNGTSNVLAGAKFHIPVLGTMAHSWIMSFPTELDAFRAYARQYPNNMILLADTYNTLKQGVPDAITIFREMKAAGTLPKSYGIRLDSGDLAYLSKEAHKMFEAAGFGDAVIAASNDLDENLIAELKLQGCVINSWGVGTNLITAKDSPSLGGVFKLVGQYDGQTFVPKIKMSDNAEKISNPGRKNVLRIYDKTTGKMKADIIILEGETIDPAQDLHLSSDKAPWRSRVIKGGTYTVRTMLVPIFHRGELVYQMPSLQDIMAYANTEIQSLWPEYLRLVNPEEMWVQRSSKLSALREQILKAESAHFF